MKTPFDFGMNLRKLREEKGITQKQLGEILYMSDSTISKYESNCINPTLQAVQNLAVFFNVSMEYLVGMEKSINISTVQLTPEQIQIMRDLAEAFRNKSTVYPKKINDRQHQIIGRIAAEFEK